MEYWKILLVLGTGVIAGFFNTLAGGGSLLTMPVLIFMGLPPAVANGTNRVAIFIQNIFGIAGFRSKGISSFRISTILGISALFGAIIGANIAIDIDGALFNKLLAVIMVLVVVYTVLGMGKKKTDKAEEKTGWKRTAVGVVSFFFIGIYGGFIQAGVGFIIIPTLMTIFGFSLVKTNSVKVFVILLYTAAALLVFIVNDQINWLLGLVLAAGNAAGAWFASRWSVDKGEAFLKPILIVAVTALAIKLWLFN
jgi:uncharacterized membrane protein YfcA